MMEPKKLTAKSNTNTKSTKKVGSKKSSMSKSLGSKSKSVTDVDANSSESEDSVREEQDEDTLQIGGGRVATASVAIDREEYLQALRDLTFDKNQLQIKNNILHRRLAEYFRKRKMLHILKPLENSEDLEEKYNQKLLTYGDLKDSTEKEINEIKLKVQAVELQYNGRAQQAEEKFEALQHLERSTGTGLIYSKKGKPMPDKTVAKFLSLQKRKQLQNTSLCLRYIRARNAVSELDAIVKKLDMIGPGLYVYQFEQLHIDNQNLMTKIEERNDELIKNRSKCVEHNQILAHIREKMSHTDEYIDFLECDLGDAEIDFTQAREELGTIKNRRDRLRYALDNERVKAGLLTRKDLLRDYQNATDEVVVLRNKKKFLEERIKISLKELREARKRMQIVKSPKESTLSFI